MTLETLEKGLKQIDNLIDYSFTSIQLQSYLSLSAFEVEENDWEKISEIAIEQLTFNAKFYDCEYLVYCPKKAIEKNDSFLISIDGDSKLFESFKNFIQEDCFEHIKAIFNRLEYLLQQENKEE